MQHLGLPNLMKSNCTISRDQTDWFRNRHPNLNIRALELQVKFNVLIRMRPRLRVSCTLAILASLFSTLLPLAYAQSQVEREWALFNQILIIGIAVGIVVFGLLFYAVIRYREKPEKRVEKNL